MSIYNELDLYNNHFLTYAFCLLNDLTSARAHFELVVSSVCICSLCVFRFGVSQNLKTYQNTKARRLGGPGPCGTDSPPKNTCN